MNNGLGGLDVGVLAIDPSNPQTVYAVAGSRVFKSTDGGASWTAMNDGLANAVVFSLAIDPGSPQTLYAETVRYPRVLLFKSTDGARTWRALNMDAAYGLTIDAAPPHTLYAASGTGLFKSIDGGDSWKRVAGLALDIVCGDGLAATQCDEQCDDGNSIDGDGCDSTTAIRSLAMGARVRARSSWASCVEMA
jgi:cysteine-rich repeat protein